MLAEVLKREHVLEAATQIKAYLEGAINGDGNRRRHDAEPGAGDLQVEDLRVTASLIGAALGQHAIPGRRRGGAPSIQEDGHPPSAFLSRDPVLSNIQSALEAYFEDSRSGDEILTESPRSGRRGSPTTPVVAERRLRRVFNKFSVTDIGWVSSLVAMGIRRFRTPHDFNPVPAASVTLPAKSRLIMVGDWGSGLPRAQNVARQMRAYVEEAKANRLDCHVIHLGDVYYSGWEYEYRKRFLPYWPVETAESGAIGSWCLNGNHDMYSGGYGYYDHLLADPRFARQGGASFFRLATPEWQILGLDTAWDDGGLKDPQAKWVRDMVSDNPHRTMILSHHQLFSAREPSSDVGRVIKEKLSDVLHKGRINAAVWGHEHRCMIFGVHDNVQYARLVGHGGVPVYADSGDPPAPATFQTSGFIESNPFERWAYMGFAVFDFDGPAIDIRYINENGQIDKRERLP